MLKINRCSITIHFRRLSYGKIKHWYCGLVKPRPQKPPYSHIVQIGDPILRVESEPIPVDLIKSQPVSILVNKMLEVAKTYNCLGLSAAQIGIALRVIVLEFNANHRKSFATEEEIKRQRIDTFPQTVIINPQLKVVDYTKVIGSEICGSITGFCADVARYHEVQIKGFNQKGEEIEFNAKGWLARIAQHELDHLSGQLYTDIMDRKSLSCSCWQEVNDHNGKIELPFSY